VPNVSEAPYNIAKPLSPEERGSLRHGSAEDVLRWALDRFHPRLALASSFGAEDVVVIDLLLALRPDARIFMLDTGRLPEETYEVVEKIRNRYSTVIEVHVPTSEAVENLEREKGLFSFRENVANRKECCQIRKVAPLRQALSGLDAWITGLRREQAPSRSEIEKAEWDDTFDLFKINPLADWTEEQVWEHIERRNLPYNLLHDEGYPSIGCAPCTRAVSPGGDPRGGRWWWESVKEKECGLHASMAGQKPRGSP